MSTVVPKMHTMPVGKQADAVKVFQSLPDTKEEVTESYQTPDGATVQRTVHFNDLTSSCEFWTKFVLPPIPSNKVLDLAESFSPRLKSETPPSRELKDPINDRSRISYRVRDV